MYDEDFDGWDDEFSADEDDEDISEEEQAEFLASILGGLAGLDIGGVPPAAPMTDVERWDGQVAALGQAILMGQTTLVDAEVDGTPVKVLAIVADFDPLTGRVGALPAAVLAEPLLTGDSPQLVPTGDVEVGLNPNYRGA